MIPGFRLFVLSKRKHMYPVISFSRVLMIVMSSIPPPYHFSASLFNAISSEIFALFFFTLNIIFAMGQKFSQFFLCYNLIKIHLVVYFA